MRHATRILVSASLAVATFAAPARADFVGLTVVREFPNQIVNPSLGIVRDVFRVYAEFTNPNDRVDTWYGTQANPFVIQNVLANGSPGSGFYRHSSGSFPPEVNGSPNDWSTWATLGVTWLGENGEINYLASSPGYPQFIGGNSLTASASLFFTEPIAPQGLGSFRISGLDTATRILLMQLTALPGEHVQGQLNLGGRISTDGGYVPFTATVQTFSSIPAAPAAVIVLAAFGWARRRARQP